MPRVRIQRIQDSVHGLMEFHGVESVVVELLRTPELQRLRRIKQLGLANYVFPGAEHSRLAHCLGASHIAIRFARRLQEIAHELFIPILCPDEMAARDLGVAALCHDLGHGPFSHAWEREIIGENFDKSAWASKLGLPDNSWHAGLRWHELVGHGMLFWPDGKLHRLLEQHELGSSERIRNVLLGKYHIPYLPRLLASDVDVDRADFIQRDTFQSGVSYGRYDLEWLLSTVNIGEASNGQDVEWVVGFDRHKAVRVIEQFLIARRALYETVYWHKTICCAENMMALFLKRLKVVVLDGARILSEKYFKPLVDVINSNPVDQACLLILDDSIIHLVIESVISSDIKDDTLKDLARRISERDLFKVVPVVEDRLDDFIRDSHWREKLCKAIEPYARGDSEYYFILDSRSFNMMAKNNPEKVFLIDKDHRAESAAETHSFSSYRDYKERISRIFTVREAVPAVKKLIEDNSA